ncbi:MAG: 16S rRNA processing protein RimM [Proteobacteria bacterium]|nr:16S rRNA processing protein RimM [Pseudomonadota bacterium]
MDSSLILIGIISKPHGIKGGVRAISYADSPDIYREIPCIYLKKKDKAISPLKISSVSTVKGAVILNFDEIKSRESVEDILGCELYIERSFLPSPSENEYYHIDLIGLDVMTTGGQLLGKICEVMQTGGNDVFVVKKGKEEHLIPAIKEVIREIDINGGKVVIDPMEGMT